MRRLSATDSSFLSIETNEWPMHVGGLTTLDASNAPDFGFERVHDLFKQRIARIPKFTWKLKSVPLGLDRPFWMGGGDFDIDNHLQRVSVPSPGGPREVGAVVGEFMSRRLDRRLPLWRMYYLDGLPDGAAAVFSMYHHCVMDGTAGASMVNLMFDFEPNPPPDTPDTPVAPVGPPGRDPSDLETLLTGALGMVATPVKVVRFGGALVRRVADLAPVMLKQGIPPAVLSRPPPTSFNHAVGPRRTLSFVSVSLDDVKSVSKHVGVTVNDVLIALCTAALERYLGENGEDACGRPFAIMVPVSVRATGDEELTNRVSAQPVSVPTGMADPVERLRAISQEMQDAKRLTSAYTGRPMPSVGELLPPVALGALARAATPLARWMPVVGNTLVSTVRGAPCPLYVAGARVTGIYSSSIVTLNMGMNFTALSTDDRVDIGITVDPDLVPDSWLVADAVPGALTALMRAAAVGDPHPVPRLAVA